MLREGMGHAGYKAKCGGSGINHICLLFLQGPCAERTSGAVGHGTASVSALSPQGGTHRSGAGNPSPPPHQCTHLQLLPRQHHRGSAGTRGAGQTLGDNDNAGHAGCRPRAPRQAHSSSNSASSQPSPWRGTVGPRCHILGRKGHKLSAEGMSPAPLTGRPGVPRGPGSPGKPFSPCPRREEQQDGEMLHPRGHPAPRGQGRRGRCPTAPAPGAPPDLLWVQTSPGREGQDPDKSGTGETQAPSQCNPHGARSEPQICQEGKGLTGVPGMPGCPCGPGRPLSPCKDTRKGQGAAWGNPQLFVLLQPSPFPRWIFR